MVSHYIKRNCLNCGKEFWTYLSENCKYCCYECSRQAKICLKEKPCSYCSRLFRPHTSRQKYCCKQCSDKAKEGIYTAYFVKCKVCGKIFKTIPSEKAKYCSRECYKKDLNNIAANSKHRHGTYEELYGKEKAEQIKAKLRNRIISQEQREKARQFHTGKKRPKEVCEKLRKIQLSKEHQAKINKTKRKNNSWKTSKLELKVKELLESKFENVKYQYRSKEYPFNCDFYVPKLNLYIEIQGSWTHGFKPYIGSDEDLKKVGEWKKRGTNYYLQAIDTWTRRDVIKRKIAKENGLNWIEFFTMKEFENWFKNLQ